MNEMMSTNALRKTRKIAEDELNYYVQTGIVRKPLDETTIIALLDEVERLREALKGAMVVAETAKGLTAENARLRAELEAAKEDMHLFAQCVTCTHTYDGGMRCRVPLKERKHKGDYCTTWQWRGPCAANCGEQGAPFDEPMGGGEG